MNKERLQELLDKYKYLKEAYKQRPALERPPKAEWWDREFEEQWYDFVSKAVRCKELEEERDFFKEQAILWRNDYKNEYEENRKLKSDIKRYEKEEDRLREENRKLKLHIEAKDKAYTALLKDYEELKEDNKRLRAEIEEWLNAVRKSLEK